MKKTLILLMVCVGLSAMPQMAAAAMPSTSIEEVSVDVQNDIKIAVKGNTLRVVGADGLVLDIYSVTGQKLKSVKLTSNDETVNTGLQRGCYIIKVGDVVRKVSIS